MAGEIAEAVCQCSSQFVSGCIVRVPECVRARLRQTRCSDDLFLAQILILFLRFVRVQLFCIHQFALKDDWIEQTVRLKMSQDSSSSPHNHLSERT